MDGRKILAILNDDADHQSSVEFASELFGSTNALVVATFLSNKAADINTRKAILADLQEKYSQRPGMKLIVRGENGLKASDLMREVRYTDLIIYPSTSDATDQFKDLPPNFSKLLVQTKVPLLLVPNDLTTVKEIFLTCDGTAESIKSIKQFCQIMGDFCRETRVTLLEFNHDYLQFQPYEEKLLIEYLKQHCNNLGIYKISDEAPEKIMKLINFNKNAMIVSSTLQTLGQSLLELPALTNRLVLKEKSPGFFGGY